MADYDVPKITGEDGILDVPSLQPDTMKGHGPWVSKPDFQEDMHFPTDFTMPEGVDNYGDASTLAHLAAVVFAMVGGFIQIYVILIGGQTFPLILFPNAEISSVFFDGVNTTYSATLAEWLFGLGAVGITLALVAVGIKVLRILPTSLADSQSTL